MKVRKKTVGFAAALLVWGLMLVLPGYAATTGTIQIPFTIVKPLPTCDLTFNGEGTLNYLLGTMQRGSMMRHALFTVSVTCPEEIDGKTVLAVNPVSGGVLQNDEESLRVQVGSTQRVDNNAPLFWLESESGQRVKLTGRSQDAACTWEKLYATQASTCRLRPVVDIPQQSPTGNFSVTLQLRVVYP